MMRGLGRRSRLAVLTLVTLSTLVLSLAADVSAKPRAMLIAPFDAGSLEREEQWIGEGIAQVLALGLDQHPAFVQIERARLRAYGRPEMWGAAVVLQAARGLRADAALYGEVVRRGPELVIHPRLLELRGASSDTIALEPVTVAEGELLVRIAALPVAYARTLKVPLTEPDATRIDRAARPTRSLRAF